MTEINFLGQVTRAHQASSPEERVGCIDLSPNPIDITYYCLATSLGRHAIRAGVSYGDRCYLEEADICRDLRLLDHLTLVTLCVPLFSELRLPHHVDSEEARLRTHATFSPLVAGNAHDMPNMVRRRGMNRKQGSGLEDRSSVTEGEASHDGVYSGSGSIYLCPAKDNVHQSALA
ncbi:hypothetical protein BC826DRAFT_1177741 [Russula brevipes]|nr:hypothetical protein BC826DRAFT_1177741 [Russula brevipes]